MQHLGDVGFQSGGDAAAQVDVDPRLGDGPGRRRDRVGIGQDAAQLAVVGALHDDDGMDDPPDLAPGPAHRREHGLDEVGHVVGDDLEDRARPLRCPVAKADQLLACGAVPGELAMPAGGRAQDRAGVTGAGKVRCVAAVERVEADVDRVGRECRVGVRRDVGGERRFRGGRLLTGPTDHVHAPRGSWLVLASAGLAAPE